MYRVVFFEGMNSLGNDLGGEGEVVVVVVVVVVLMVMMLVMMKMMTMIVAIVRTTCR